MADEMFVCYHTHAWTLILAQGRFYMGGADPSPCRGITASPDPSSTFDLRANQQVFCFLVDLQPEGL